MERARAWLILFRDAVARIGDALEYTFDDIEFFCDYATAAEDVDLGWLKMDKGTNAALRGGWNGKVGGKTVINLTVVWYLSKKLAEGWVIDEDQYHLTVKGEPNLFSRLKGRLPGRLPDHSPDRLSRQAAQCTCLLLPVPRGANVDHPLNHRHHSLVPCLHPIPHWGIGMGCGRIRQNSGYLALWQDLPVPQRQQKRFANDQRSHAVHIDMLYHASPTFSPSPTPGQAIGSTRRRSPCSQETFGTG